nr:hypothetical protein [Tanacetum cinerariifolium]
VTLLSSASGSMSQDNTKKNRIRRTQRKAKKNKLEDRLRTVSSSLNKNSVVDTKATSSVTNFVSNVNSDLKCASCNGCLFSDNHDACIVAYINSVNASIKSKSVKTPVKRKIWQPTGNSSLGPALNEMTPGTISSGLVQTSSPSTSYVPPLRNDWDLLFQPMFDELLNPPPSVVNQAPEVIAPIAEVIPPIHADSTGSPSSTTVDQDAPSTSKTHTTTEIQTLVIHQDVGDDNLDMEVAHMGNDPLFGVPIPEVTSLQSSSTASPQSIVQTNHPMRHHNSKWTKDHPLNNIISQLSRPVSTR